MSEVLNRYRYTGCYFICAAAHYKVFQVLEPLAKNNKYKKALLIYGTVTHFLPPVLAIAGNILHSKKCRLLASHLASGAIAGAPISIIAAAYVWLNVTDSEMVAGIVTTISLPLVMSYWKSALASIPMIFDE